MKCQIPGCHRTASHTIKIQGVYSGIYLDEALHHCGHHRAATLNESVDELKTEKLASAASVNPYLDAPLVSRNAG